MLCQNQTLFLPNIMIEANFDQYTPISNLKPQRIQVTITETIIYNGNYYFQCLFIAAATYWPCSVMISGQKQIELTVQYSLVLVLQLILCKTISPYRDKISESVKRYYLKLLLIWLMTPVTHRPAMPTDPSTVNLSNLHNSL